MGRPNFQTFYSKEFWPSKSKRRRKTDALLKAGGQFDHASRSSLPDTTFAATTKTNTFMVLQAGLFALGGRHQQCHGRLQAARWAAEEAEAVAH